MPTPSPKPGSLPRSWLIAKDVGAFLIGAYMMISQTLSDTPNTLLALIGFAALGVAGSGVATRLLDRGGQP